MTDKKTFDRSTFEDTEDCHCGPQSQEAGIICPTCTALDLNRYLTETERQNIRSQFKRLPWPGNDIF